MTEHGGDLSPTLHAAFMERKEWKLAGPSRNNSEKIKRKRMSLYARPTRTLEMGNMPCSDVAGALAINTNTGVKYEDQVMREEDLGSITLTPIPTEPNTLMGPQEEARQEQ
jgi:hypothetical protein